MFLARYIRSVATDSGFPLTLKGKHVDFRTGIGGGGAITVPQARSPGKQFPINYQGEQLLWQMNVQHWLLVLRECLVMA